MHLDLILQMCIVLSAYQKVKVDFPLQHKGRHDCPFWSSVDWDSCVPKLDWKGTWLHSVDCRL